MKLSIFAPTIRPHLLEKWYESALASCSYDFEAVFCGPFELPESLEKLDNIKMLHSYSHPTVCAQLAAMACKGELLYHTVDDVLFYPDKIDRAIEQYQENCIICMKYNEGIDYKGDSIPNESWYAQATPEYKDISQINPQLGSGGHFLMDRMSFLKYGGFDCRFEYLVHANHDLIFRMQKNGWTYELSSDDVSAADHVPGTTGDHAPIHYAQLTHDWPSFYNVWISPRESSIQLNNWTLYPDVWERRFGNNKPSSYEEMYS